jgi:hypothetical protein
MGIAELRKGDEVYAIVRHVSKSGMNRWIDLFVVRDDRVIGILSTRASSPHQWQQIRKTLGERDTEHAGWKVHGTGMNMCQHLVSRVSQVVFNDPYALRLVEL